MHLRELVPAAFNKHPNVFDGLSQTLRKFVYESAPGNVFPEVEAPGGGRTILGLSKNAGRAMLGVGDTARVFPVGESE